MEWPVLTDGNAGPQYDAPLTMAGFNPARDLAPRIFSSLAGWGSQPFTVNGSGWLTVYILAPIAGFLGSLAMAFPRNGADSPWVFRSATTSLEMDTRDRHATLP